MAGWSKWVNNLKTKALFLTLILTFAFCGVTLARGSDPGASEPLVLTDEQSEYPLGLHMEILEDHSGELAIEQVSSPAYAAQFVPSQVEVPNFGYSDSVYWVRMRLDNRASQADEWMLEVDFSNTQYVDLYTPQAEGGFEARQTGVLRPLSTRELLYPRIVFTLDLPDPGQQMYYLRFQSGASMTLGLTLFTEDAFWVAAGRDLMLHWLFFGGLLTLLGYHLFLLIALKERTYLYFVLMLVGLLAVLTDLDGYLGVYIFPNLYHIKAVYFPLAVSFMYIMILLFSGEFLGLRTRLPKLYRVNLGCAAVWGVLASLVPFTSYGNIAQLMTPWQMVSMGVTLVVGVAAWRKGFHPARFFMVAWLGMAASLLLFVMVRQGIAPSTFFTENVYQLGMIVMAVCWSIALADRITVLKAETENANRNLQRSEHRLSQILEGMPLGVVVYAADQKPRYLNRRSAEILGNPAQNILPSVKAGRTLAQALEYFSFKVAGTLEPYPVENFPVYRALQGEPAYADDLEAHLGDKHIPLEVWASPVRDAAGKVESVVAVFDDITQRKRVETELAEYRKHLEALVEMRADEIKAANIQLRLRLDWLSAAHKSHQAITGVTSLATEYDDLSTRILQLLDAKLVFILRWEGQSEQSQILNCSLQGENTPAREIFEDCFQKDSPLRREIGLGKIMIWSADRVASFPGPVVECFLQQDIHLLILAPMLIHQSVVGVLGVAVSTPSQDFLLRQVDLVERMAFDLASLSQAAILLDQALALAALDERNRLARDLHDSVTQVLFSASLLAEVLPQIWHRDPDLGLQRLEKLRQLTRGALAEMRTMLLELRPTAVVNTQLGELLVQLAEAVTSRSGLLFQLFIEQIRDLPENVHVNFYRVAQEALNNVVKHAQAKQITMSLSQKFLAQDAEGQFRREVSLMIRDDGVGYAVGENQPIHLGTGIMRERAAAIQASLFLESRPGYGTQVTLTWLSESENIRSNP
jgi:signal transduction histidine kinase